MGSKDKRVDAFIEGANPFAKPILRRLRTWVHRHAPGVEETLKWGMPHFQYRGKMFCGMSAFKEHCGFGFWHPMMRRDDTSLEGMGSFGKIRTVDDLPTEAEFAKMAREAMRLTDEGVKAPPKPKAEQKELVVPKALADALKRSKAAAKTFDEFSYSHRREYIEWIAEAKTDETRERRVKTTIEQLAEGKPRHWKYLAKA